MGPNDNTFLSDEGQRLIKLWEDGGPVTFPFQAYDDGGGTWTGPYGITDGVSEGQEFTEIEAQKAFDLEIAHWVGEAHKLITTKLTQHEFDAVVSFFYNCGTGKCGDLIDTINSGAFDKVPSVWMRHINVNGEPWRGLITRRHNELALWNEGDSPPVPPGPITPPAPAPWWPTMLTSKAMWTLVTGAIAAIANWWDSLINNTGVVQSDVTNVQSLVQFVFSTTGNTQKTVFTTITIVAIIAAIIIHTGVKRKV